MECYKNNPHHTTGDAEAFTPGAYWQVMLAQKNSSTQSSWLRVSPDYFWTGERQFPNTPHPTPKNLEKLQMLTFNIKNKLITNLKK